MEFDKLVEKYQRLVELKREREADIKKINEGIDTLKGKLLEVFNEKGIESLKTTSGTIYKSTRASASVADWDIFLAHVRKHDLWQLLERRCAATKAEEYIAVHSEPPPGVNFSRAVTLNIRQS